MNILRGKIITQYKQRLNYYDMFYYCYINVLLIFRL